MKKVKSCSFYLLVLITLFLMFRHQTHKEGLPYDVVSESLIIGRLMESERSGIGSHSGLTGMLSDHSDDDDYMRNSFLQFELLKHPEKRNRYTGYTTYDSQPGGQGMIFSIFHTLSPHNLGDDILLMKNIALFINSCIFTIFIGWCKRNFGILPSLFVLSGIVASSWIWIFSDSLWWCLWAFYVPFLSMLSALEKNIPSGKLLLFVYLSIVIKCFFNGFEYISTTLLSVYVPVVFYFVKQRRSFIQFLAFSIKSALAMLLGVFTIMGLLVYQIASIKGSLTAGINHILLSYQTRTADITVSGKVTELTDNMYLGVLMKYLSGNAFSWLPAEIPFLAPIMLFFIAGILLFRTHKELALATFFSFLAPVSWYWVFIQHSNIHYHLNYIVWYIPSMLLGFLCLGVCFNSLVKKRKS